MGVIRWLIRKLYYVCKKYCKYKEWVSFFGFMVNDSECGTIERFTRCLFRTPIYLHSMRCFPSLRNEKRRCCYTILTTIGHVISREGIHGMLKYVSSWLLLLMRIPETHLDGHFNVSEWTLWRHITCVIGISGDVAYCCSTFFTRIICCRFVCKQESLSKNKTNHPISSNSHPSSTAK